MKLTMNTNLMAFSAANHLSRSYAAAGESVGRLSSGQRIRGAADDAAGLCVREGLRAEWQVLEQGIRNANDGISMIKMADGALAIVDEKLIRMRELAEQAATGTYSDDQRRIMNLEFQAMGDEIARISEATAFNGVKLLDGSLKSANQGQGVKIHFGSGADAAEDYYHVPAEDVSAVGLGVDQRVDVFSTDGGEFKINTNDVYMDTGVASCVLNDGTSVVTWASDQSGDLLIYGQRYDQDGNLLSGEFEISATGPLITLDQAMAATTDGGFMAVWGVDGAVEARRFDSAGMPIGDEFQVNTTIAGNQNIQVAALTDGSSVIAWTEVQAGPTFRIVAQRLDDMGNLVDGEFQINTGAGGAEHFEPSLTGLPDGGFLSTWVSNQTGDYCIHGRRFDAEGAPVGSEFQVNNSSGALLGCPDVTALPNGDSVITWWSDHSGSRHVYGQRYDQFGEALGTDFQISQAPSAGLASIETLSDGGFMVTWQSDQSGDWRIYGRQYGPDGTPRGAEFMINTNTGGDQDRPVVVVASEGDVLVTWVSDHSGDNQIYGQRYDCTQTVERRSINTQEEATDALDMIRAAILKKDRFRASLGSVQNRLENTVTGLTVQTENLMAAEACISDVDVAAEMTTFTNRQIKSQAATAMLAQANALPQMTLQLLQNQGQG